MAEIYSKNPIIKMVMLKGQDGKDGEAKLINQADGSGLSFWIGTRAQYNAIPEGQLIENCVYYITDDTVDDFTAALNALDNKVDNITDTLQGTAVTRINQTDFDVLSKDYFKSRSFIKIMQKSGFTYVYFNLAFASDLTESEVVIAKNDLLKSDINNSNVVASSAGKLSIVNTDSSGYLYLTGIQTISANDYFAGTLVYPSKEV